ncbi:MAG: iron-containing alcohol dehydrogenase [bacterium]
MVPDFFQFYFPTKVLFQAGISKDFSNELSLLGLSRMLVITDEFLLKSGMIGPILEGLKNGGVEKTAVFSEVPPNSELKTVQKACEKGKEIDAEGILAVGGGSVMDTAKAANILLTLGGDLVGDYSGAHTLTSPLKPLIAIPTTSGTGSEVTQVAVILDESNGVKLSFLDRYLYPTLAILDPELTLSMPPKLTAMTGMDALTHAIEAYTSLEANPYSDAFSMKAIRMIKDFLPRAVEKGDDLEARSHMLVASNLAGVAFDHAMVGVVHSMSHSVGAVAHVPHGLANSILLPWGMEYNLEVAKGRYAGVAKRLGVETKGRSEEEEAVAAIQKVKDLRTKLKTLCGLPDRLSEAGVKEEDLPKIAQLSVEDGSSFYNPREVVEDEILATLKKAF